MTDSKRTVVPVILAGGVGTRLWPLSRADYPKQFLALGGEYSLLQETALRFAGATTAAPVVVCSENNRFLTAEQLSEIKLSEATIILEPVPRDTAPAISLAAWHVHQADPEAIIVVLPADHKIADTEHFQSVIQAAAIRAESDHLVTLGISPTRPETGYGYITAESAPANSSDGARVVKQFLEKPDTARAEELIQQGNRMHKALNRRLTS